MIVTQTSRWVEEDALHHHKTRAGDDALLGTTLATSLALILANSESSTGNLWCQLLFSLFAIWPQVWQPSSATTNHYKNMIQLWTGRTRGEKPGCYNASWTTNWHIWLLTEIQSFIQLLLSYINWESTVCFCLNIVPLDRAIKFLTSNRSSRMLPWHSTFKQNMASLQKSQWLFWWPKSWRHRCQHMWIILLSA